MIERPLSFRRWTIEREKVGGKVGINKLVQTVERESALVRLDSGASSDPIFQQSQWTWPWKKFSKDSPDKEKRRAAIEESGESASEGHRKSPTK